MISSVAETYRFIANAAALRTLGLLTPSRAKETRGFTRRKISKAGVILTLTVNWGDLRRGVILNMRRRWIMQRQVEEIISFVNEQVSPLGWLDSGALVRVRPQNCPTQR